MKQLISLTILVLCTTLIYGQADRWQQSIEYVMDIDFNADDHTFEGTQEIKYYNNSPDTLNKVFYHLYFNAFQPNSMMDVKSRTVADPDRRVEDRISKLKPNEIGFHNILSLEQDGKATNYHVEGTILEVTLAKPIMPHSSTQLVMKFESQVPVQVRRSGRDSAEGISYSMSQWYPKLAEYDYQGWHANPYVGREFYGIWGDYTVTIKLDRKYTIGATGVLQNAKKMGHGYSEANTKKKGLFKKKKLKWTFKAENVHDFVWAADKEYTHLIKKTDAGTELHYLYQENEKTKDNWEALHGAMNEAESYMNANYGTYPYPVYYFIQGGDGGMEYPMATLITGERSFPSLVGVSIHEWMHSWYQMVLGTNESLYPWMDEGFTSYASAEVMNHLRSKGLISGDVVDNPHYETVRGYARFALSGKEEALSTHADHYISNTAYGVGSYTKGAVFLKQLNYIIGDKDFRRGMKRYYHEWGFKHPNPNDFIRVMEKVSNLELDWFREYWVNTTHTIDYGIKSVAEDSGSCMITLEKTGVLPMPIDLLIEMNDGRSQRIYIPLRIMRGEKQGDSFSGKTYADWPWTHPQYTVSVDGIKSSEIKKITIDPSGRLADVDIANNVWPILEGEEVER